MKDYLVNICKSVRDLMNKEIEESEKAGYSLEVGEMHAYKQGKARLFRLIIASKQLYPNLVDLFDFIENMISCINNYNDLNYIIESYLE